MAGDHKERLAELAGRMAKLLLHHILIPVGLGAKHCSLSHKWAALLHCFRILSCGWEMVAQLFQIIINVTSDFGVEAQLQEVPSVDPNAVLPYWDERAKLQGDSSEEFGGEMAFALQYDAPRVDLRGAVRIIGEEHNLHTIQEHVFGKMPGFKAWYGRAKEVAKLLGHKFYQKFVIQ